MRHGIITICERLLQTCRSNRRHPSLVSLIDGTRQSFARLQLDSRSSPIKRDVVPDHKITIACSVKLADRRPDGDYADRFLGLAEGLERLFNRHVDLVTEESLRNPRFKAEVESTKRAVYEAENPVVAG